MVIRHGLRLTLSSYTNPIAWKNLPHHYDLSLFYTVWHFDKKRNECFTHILLHSRYGSLSNFFLSTSSMSRPEVRPWKNLRRFSTEKTQKLDTWICMKLRKISMPSPLSTEKVPLRFTRQLFEMRREWRGAVAKCPNGFCQPFLASWRSHIRLLPLFRVLFLPSIFYIAPT